jgi:hypothetical protein
MTTIESEGTFGDNPRQTLVAVGQRMVAIDGDEQSVGLVIEAEVDLLAEHWQRRGESGQQEVPVAERETRQRDEVQDVGGIQILRHLESGSSSPVSSCMMRSKIARVRALFPERLVWGLPVRRPATGRYSRRGIPRIPGSDAWRTGYGGAHPTFLLITVVAGADLRVGPGTVAKAYRALEAEGFLVSRTGSGTRVSPTASTTARPVLEAVRRLAGASTRARTGLSGSFCRCRAHLQIARVGGIRPTKLDARMPLATMEHGPQSFEA